MQEKGTILWRTFYTTIPLQGLNYTDGYGGLERSRRSFISIFKTYLLLSYQIQDLYRLIYDVIVKMPKSIELMNTHYLNIYGLILIYLSPLGL